MSRGNMRFTVHGEPATQGSMTAVYNRQLGLSAVRHANAPALGVWRHAVAEAALQAGAEVWEGPIAISVTFGMKAPKSTAHGYPKRYDLDKLVRAVLDALTGICYANDNQVTVIRAMKIWADVTDIEVRQFERRQDAHQTTLWREEDAAGLGEDEAPSAREGWLPVPYLLSYFPSRR